MTSETILPLLLGRGLGSALAERIARVFPDWATFSAAESSELGASFTPEEVQEITRAKIRREIPRATVQRLVDECAFRCCLCWNFDADVGVVIHHIRPHAVAPDDRFENLVILCADHHAKAHTTWELTRSPYAPEVIIRSKADFTAAIAAFRAGRRPAPGRETDTPPGPRSAPPLPPGHFTGRNVILRDVADRLCSKNRRVAIVGMGGVGKTALALSVAESCRDAFPGGVFWGEARVGGIGIGGVVRSWIISLGRDGSEVDDVSEMDSQQQLSLLAELVVNRSTAVGRLLLIIDDVTEDSLEDIVALGSRVPANASLLLTTRELTVAVAVEAAQFRLEPLDRAHSRLLLEAVSGSFLVSAEASAVDVLLNLLGDLPLAVELVARQIAVREAKPGFNIAALCQQLEGFNPGLLSFPGHRGVAMSFALSYDGLDEPERRMFRALGSFAEAPLIKSSFAAIVSATESDAEGALDRFVVLSLLNWGPEAGEYRVHPLLHKYAEFLFDRADPSERDLIRDRFYRHFTSLSASAPKPPREGRQTVDPLLSNLVRAIHVAANRGDHKVVVATVLRLCAELDYFTFRNLERESMPLLELAVSAARRLGDAGSEAACISHLGTACSRLGRLKDAIAYYERSIAISRKIGNDYDLACGLQNLATTLMSEAINPRRAERLLSEALSAAQRSQNTDTVIGCLSTLGSIHRHTGNFAEAARLYRLAIKAAQSAGDQRAEGNNLSNLGLVIVELGDEIEGERMVRAALSIAVEVGDKRGEGNRTGHLGNFLMTRAKSLPAGPERYCTLESAARHMATALRIAEETGDEEKAATWLMNLGLVSTLSGNPADGISRYEKALRLAQDHGFFRLEAQTRYNLGRSFAAMGDVRQALDHFRISTRLLREMGSPMADKTDAYVRHFQRLLSNQASL